MTHEFQSSHPLLETSCGLVGGLGRKKRIQKGREPTETCPLGDEAAVRRKSGELHVGTAQVPGDTLAHRHSLAHVTLPSFLPTVLLLAALSFKFIGTAQKKPKGMVRSPNGSMPGWHPNLSSQGPREKPNCNCQEHERTVKSR